MSGDELVDEPGSFRGLWPGGYCEGDPLEPLSKSGYGQLNFMSVLHATYLRCIKPYVNSGTVALEIGPGRGAWTKGLLRSREVYVLDVLSAEETGLYEYLGHPENVEYLQVTDFACQMLPRDHFTYMFSFGCLCHVSFEGIAEYARNIYPKLKHGANCFWMIADFEKYDKAVLDLKRLSIWSALAPARRRYFPVKWLFTYLMRRNRPKPTEKDENKPGAWFHAGIERTCSMLEGLGYKIVDPDVGTSLRDPIVHFLKP